MMPQTMPVRMEEALLGPETGLRIHQPMRYAEPTPPPAGMKPLAYLQYRWVLVLFLGGLSGTVFAGAAWSLIPSKYTTYSLVRVFSTDPVVHSKEDVQSRNDFATYLKTQAAMMRSHFVLTAAMRDPNVAALSMLREQPDPVRYLEEELRIEFQEGSEIIKVLLSGEDPRAISLIVNSIQDAFFREVVDEEILRKKARLKQLEDATTKMKDEVKRIHGQIQQADIDMPMSELIPGLNAQIAANQLVRLKENLAKLEAEGVAWENEKANLEKKIANPVDEVPPPPSGYSESLDHDPRLMTLARKSESMTSRIDYLVKLSGDPNLASVVDLRNKVAEAQKERETFKKERLAEYQKSQLPIVEKKLKNDLERCTTTLAQTATQKEKLAASIEEYQKTLGQIGPAGEALQNWPKVDVRERSKIITEMLDKANLLRLEVNAPPRVRDFQRAAVPLKKEMKKQILGTILAGLMGFGLVGLGVVLFESRVRRTLSLADVQRTVLGPIAGALPASGDPAVSPDAIGEAVEKIRAYLAQQFSRSGGKIVAVTSALTEEGKGFLAIHLAESFALAGCRTALIDFDLRTPTLHRRLQIENERGLCEVIREPIEFRELMYALPNGVAFLPAGRWSADVRAGLTAERLEPLFLALRQMFDVVIVNTHSLLAVAESFLLCRNADGVLLSVAKQETRLPLLSRAHEKLATLAPEAFGVVYQGATAEECLN